MKLINNWRILPASEGTICLTGVVDGKQIQTSSIKAARAGEVLTENTHYKLGDKSPGMWEIQLQMKRKDKYDNLCKYGIL